VFDDDEVMEVVWAERDCVGGNGWKGAILGTWRLVSKIKAHGMKPYAANPTHCKQKRTVYQPQ
jgi:hypothetical protein